MPRPHCLRWIGRVPSSNFFKPAGVPTQALETVLLTLDEMEALKLADLEGLYQEDAAKRMKISRPTFTRLIQSARKKVAEALIEGKALRMEGGPIDPRAFNEGPRGAGAFGRRGLGRGMGCRKGFGRNRKKGGM